MVDSRLKKSKSIGNWYVSWNGDEPTKIGHIFNKLFLLWIIWSYVFLSQKLDIRCGNNWHRSAIFPHESSENTKSIFAILCDGTDQTQKDAQCVSGLFCLANTFSIASWGGTQSSMIFVRHKNSMKLNLNAVLKIHGYKKYVMVSKSKLF